MYFLAQKFNSHAVGMADAQPYAFKVDFVRNLISEPAAQFFVYILNFIFSPIYEIKISEKNSWFENNLIFEGRFRLFNKN